MEFQVKKADARQLREITGELLDKIGGGTTSEWAQLDQVAKTTVKRANNVIVRN